MPSVGQQPYNTTIKNYSKVMFVHGKVMVIHHKYRQIKALKRPVYLRITQTHDSMPRFLGFVFLLFCFCTTTTKA